MHEPQSGTALDVAPQHWLRAGRAPCGPPRVSDPASTDRPSLPVAGHPSRRDGRGQNVDTEHRPRARRRKCRTAWRCGRRSDSAFATVWLGFSRCATLAFESVAAGIRRLVHALVLLKVTASAQLFGTRLLDETSGASAIVTFG